MLLLQRLAQPQQPQHRAVVRIVSRVSFGSRWKQKQDREAQHIAAFARITQQQLQQQQRQWNSTTTNLDAGGGEATPLETAAASTVPSYYTKEQRMVMEECRKLHSSIMPLNDKIRGPLSPQSDQGTALPFVLLLGNHSSGKSSFLNYVLGRTIQTTGVAPTDDTFTIVAPGPHDRDQDGPAVIGDPDLGFAPLRQFGPTLMHHVQLKIRREISSNFLMVDTPGMIDAPGNYSGMLQQQQQQQQGQNHANPNDASAASIMDRGYDFTGVVRWLADRADVVLLFFDPDKPGTTGETLSILLHSLSGMDHKLLIVLNKADQFSKIHDFARAYGSLCWNLSKVIPRKDLPRIFTMCLPVMNDDGTKDTKTSNSNSNNSSNGGLHDLYTARDEVVSEVRKAPARRMDNWITGLHDAVSQLHMHATLIQDVQQRWSQMYWSHKRQELSLALTGGSLSSLVAMYGGDVLGTATGGALGMVLATLTTCTVLGTGGLWWYHDQQLQTWQRQAGTRDELFHTFSQTHGRAIQDGDEYVAAVWQRIRPGLAMALHQQQSSHHAGGGGGISGDSAVASLLRAKVTNQDLQQLQTILDEDIPRLRRLASPPHYGKDD